jgi:hypothetical protein
MTLLSTAFYRRKTDNALAGGKRKADMREIEFRGQREDTGKWVYGGIHYYYGEVAGERAYIILVGIIPKFINVIPKTVGEYTGLKDSAGKMIFEGDIVKSEGENYIIEYIKALCAFEMKSINRDRRLKLYNSVYSLIIGNIHDNPELVSREKF